MQDSQQKFAKEKQIWETLGEQDPLWAVLSEDGKQGGRWDLKEFLELGEADVARYHDLLRKHCNAGEHLGSTMDFGCGVGRLTLAWSRRCERVVGVDVSAGMIKRAEEILGNVPNAAAVLNESDNLANFGSETFDLVASHICLQHIPSEIIPSYIREFGRVSKRGGFVAFQLPSRHLSRSFWPMARRFLVDSLPGGLGKHYRRLRSGSDVRFKVFTVPSEEVIAAANDSGLKLIHMEPDRSAGTALESFIYLFRKEG